MAELAPKVRSTPVLAKGLTALALITVFACASAIEACADPADSDASVAERLSRRVAAMEGRLQLPLPGAPDPATLNDRLALAGLKLGSPVMIRVFKAESQLEIWMQRDGTYVPFASYPICYWSGTLGPKLREGDRQAPEGFYTITIHQLHDGRRWTRSLDVGYPNVFDEANQRSGSAILVHGGCNSVGCFAMTDRVNAEIYELVSAALSAGVVWVPVHVFPFRMTDENFATHAANKWSGFWITLKQGYDLFERTHLPPHIGVCNKYYTVADARPGIDTEAGPVALCEPAPGATPQVVAEVPAAPPQPPAQAAQATQEAQAVSAVPAILISASAVRAVEAPKAQPAETSAASAAPRKKRVAARGCSASRPSCRRFTALRANRMMVGRTKLSPRTVANMRVRKRVRVR